jgi:hypothetical protein
VFGRLEEFVWSRHRAFEIVPSCRSSGFHGEVWSFGRRIVATTNEYDSYMPIRDNPNLYRAFANIRDEQALFEFVKRYGALTEPGLTPSSKDPVFGARTSCATKLNARWSFSILSDHSKPSRAWAI